MRPPRAKSGASPYCVAAFTKRGSIALAEVDVLLQDAGGPGRRLDLGNDLRGEVPAELGLILRQRVVDHAVERGRQLLGLGADRLGDDRPPARGVGAIVGERARPRP